MSPLKRKKETTKRKREESYPKLVENSDVESHMGAGSSGKKKKVDKELMHE